MPPVLLRVLFLLLLSAGAGGLHAQPAPPAGPARWHAEIDRLTAGDAARPPPPGGVVFVGSSSIRLWTTLAEDFPGVRTINRGFGGSELADTVHFADRLILACQPAAVVVYAGENDLAAGKTPETVLADFRALRTKLHAALPGLRLLYLAIKESPSRARIHEHVRRANALLAAECARDPRCTFVDTAAALRDASGRPQEDLYQPDRLHLRPAGYARWKEVLAPHLQP